jgi:hypothetical protein
MIMMENYEGGYNGEGVDVNVWRGPMKEGYDQNQIGRYDVGGYDGGLLWKGCGGEATAEGYCEMLCWMWMVYYKEAVLRGRLVW